MIHLITSADGPESPITIDTPSFILKIYKAARFAEYIIKSDTLLSEEVAKASKKILEETCPGVKYFLLVSTEGFFKLTKRARKISADPLFSNHLAAVGCYTSNPTLSLLGELYNKINKPAVPTKVFTSRENAQEWLSELMQQQAESTNAST